MTNTLRDPRPLTPREQKLFDKHIDWAYKRACRYARLYPRRRYSVDYQDVKQEALIALWIAAQDFDPSLEFKFETYAQWRVIQRTQRLISKEISGVANGLFGGRKWITQCSTSTDGGVGHMHDNEEYSYHPHQMRAQPAGYDNTNELVSQIIQKLPARSIRILLRHLRGESLQDIALDEIYWQPASRRAGSMVGAPVSRERVRQIRNAAYELVREDIEKIADKPCRVSRMIEYGFKECTPHNWKHSKRKLRRSEVAKRMEKRFGRQPSPWMLDTISRRLTDSNYFMPLIDDSASQDV